MTLNASNYPSPVFIVGTPRSGTTLLRLLINSHPKISITPESSFLFRADHLWRTTYKDFSNAQQLNEFIEDLKTLPQVKDWLPHGLSAEKLLKNFRINSLSDAINAIFASYAQSHNKLRWGDKTPKNLHCMDSLIENFNNPHILVIVRDCRDVALSLHQAEFAKTSHITSSIRWQKDISSIVKAKLKHPDNLYIVRYEDLLENTQETISSILEFLNLEQDNALIESYLSHEDDITHTKNSLHLMAPDRCNIGKWRKKMPARHIAECEHIARQGIIQFDYDLTSPDRKISFTRYYFFRLFDLLFLSVNSSYLKNHIAYAKLWKKHFSKKLLRTFKIR